MIKNDIGRIRTCAGEPNGFQVHRLNHSATMSSQNIWVHKHIKSLEKITKVFNQFLLPYEFLFYDNYFSLVYAN